MPKKRKRDLSSATVAATTRRRPAWIWFIWVVSIVLVVIGMASRQPAVRGESATEPGAPAAPPFQVRTLDGRVLSDDQLRGKVVLINFWATWCPPCRAEMPGFENAYQRYGGSDFVVVGVAMDAGSADGVQRFLTERHITYPVAMATTAMVQNFGGVNLLPHSFLLDRQGRIRNEIGGEYDSTLLEKHVQGLLRESPSVAWKQTEGP